MGQTTTKVLKSIWSCYTS